MATSTPIPSLVMCYKNESLCSIVQIKTEENPLTFLTQTWLKSGHKIAYNKYVQNEKEIQELNGMFSTFRIIRRNLTTNDFSDIHSESLQTDKSKTCCWDSSLKTGQILSTNSDHKDVNIRIEVTVHRDTRIQESREGDIAERVKLCKRSMEKISETIIVWNTKLKPGQELIMDFNHNTRQHENIDIPEFFCHKRQHGSF